MDKDGNVPHGTTVLGIVCEDGIVLASDRKTTSGFYVMRLNSEKIHKINGSMGLATAGNVSDIQMIVKWLIHDSNIQKYQYDEVMTTEASANILLAVLHRYYKNKIGYIVHMIIGGIDEAGPVLYEVTSDGAFIPHKKAVSCGSGAPMAGAILQDRYEKDIVIGKGVDLAIRAVWNAIKKDAASGGGIEVVTITKEKGYVKIDPVYVKEKMQEIETISGGD